MASKTERPHTLRLILLAALCFELAAATQSETVYRCPGPPVIYTDAITAQEAKARGCRSIESRWFEVAVGNDIKAHADTQSMQRNGQKVKVWLKWTYAKAEETKTYPKKSYMSEKTLAIYHCTDRSSTTIQVIRYADSFASGEVVESISIPEVSAEYRDIAPETIGESILEYICIASAPGKK